MGFNISHSKKTSDLEKKGIANTLSDQDRIWEIGEAYNKIFAGFKKREYDGSNREKSKYAICLIRNDVSFYIEMGSSANGNMRRIINFLKEFAKIADKIQERNKELQKRINDITNELKVKSPYTNSITECESKLRELRKEIYDSMGKGCDSFLRF